MQALFVKLMLFIIILLVVGMSWLVWINSGSQQSYELLWPILGGLLAATFFLLKSAYAPLPNIESNTDILLLAKARGDTDLIPLQNLVILRFGAKPSDGYMHIEGENLAFKEKISKKKENSLSVEDDNYFLELVEWATFTWMVQNYLRHWQVKRDWFDGISGGGGSIQIQDNAYKKTEKIEIHDLLKGNRFAEIDKKGKNGFVHIYLPEGTVGKYKKVNSIYHVLTFKNKNLTLEISFMHKGGGELGASDLANKIKKKGGSGWAHHISVNFKVRFNRWRRWSILTNKQKEWIEDLCDFYNKSFSWYILKSKLEKTL